MVLLDELRRYKQGNLSHAESVSLFFAVWPEKQRALKAFLETDDRFSREKLRTELIGKLQEIEANTGSTEFVKFHQPKLGRQAIDPASLPPHLRSEWNRLSPLIREISHLHGRLFYCNTDEQRYDVAKNIIRQVRERRAIWDQIDDHIAGKKAEPVPVAVTPAAQPIDRPRNYELEDQLRRLRVTRSKLKKQPHRKDKLAVVEQQIQELEKQR